MQIGKTRWNIRLRVSWKYQTMWAMLIHKSKDPSEMSDLFGTRLGTGLLSGNEGQPYACWHWKIARWPDWPKPDLNAMSVAYGGKSK